MKTMEEIVITLDFGGTAIDLEVPAFLPVGELSNKILQTLNHVRPEVCRGTRRLVLEYHGKTLSQMDTLASCGIWDGSILHGEAAGYEIG